MAKTTALHYSTIREVDPDTRIIINLRLDDACSNGHQDFSITGTVRRRGRGDRWEDSESGAIGNYIVKHFPEFAIFNRLHLATYQGYPVYTLANGLFFLKSPKHKVSKESFIKYYNITPEQYDAIQYSDTETELYVNLFGSGIIDRWHEEARQAIILLEKLTGDTFIVTSPKETLVQPKDVADYLSKRAAGYFSTEAKDARETISRQERYYAINKEIEQEQKEASNKAVKRAQILYALSCTLKSANMDPAIFNGFYLHGTDDLRFYPDDCKIIVTDAEIALINDFFESQKELYGVTVTVKD